jgi:hypothetical protein
MWLIKTVPDVELLVQSEWKKIDKPMKRKALIRSSILGNKVIRKDYNFSWTNENNLHASEALIFSFSSLFPLHLSLPVITSYIPSAWSHVCCNPTLFFCCNRQGLALYIISSCSCDKGEEWWCEFCAPLSPFSISSSFFLPILAKVCMWNIVALADYRVSLKLFFQRQVRETFVCLVSDCK